MLMRKRILLSLVSFFSHPNLILFFFLLIDQNLDMNKNSVYICVRDDIGVCIYLFSPFEAVVDNIGSSSS